MNVKFVKELKDDNLIHDFFEKIGKDIPKGFEDYFKKYNGGRPEKNEVQLNDGSEVVLNNFLSFNHDDKDNVYKAWERMCEENYEMIPFARDPSGDYYCLKGEEIFFYRHEEENCILIVSSFEEFINMLK